MTNNIAIASLHGDLLQTIHCFENWLYVARGRDGMLNLHDGAFYCGSVVIWGDEGYRASWQSPRGQIAGRGYTLKPTQIEAEAALIKVARKIAQDEKELPSRSHHSVWQHSGYVLRFDELRAMLQAVGEAHDFMTGFVGDECQEEPVDGTVAALDKAHGLLLQLAKAAGEALPRDRQDEVRKLG